MIAANPAIGGAIKATINWICERSFDPSEGFRKEDYAREADVSDFLPHLRVFDFVGHLFERPRDLKQIARLFVHHLSAAGFRYHVGALDILCDA